MPAPATTLNSELVSTDLLIFPCPSCAKSVSAPQEMIGEEVACPFCKEEFLVPDDEEPNDEPIQFPVDAEKVRQEIHNLEGQLKENMTQTTELRGNMSRLNMELHRHQLRLEKLQERAKTLQAEIAANQAKLAS